MPPIILTNPIIQPGRPILPTPIMPILPPVQLTNIHPIHPILPTNTFPPIVLLPNCTQAPAGMVGWWRGDGNTLDSSGLGNNGIAINIGYTIGIVGQAFACDPNSFPYGTYTGIQIPDQPAYVLTNSLSIEGWVRPRGDGYGIFWRGDNRPGLDPYFLSMQGNNNLRFYIEDESGNSAMVGTYLTYNQWTHVAATLDGSTGTMSIYTNGVLADQTVTDVRPFGNLIPGDSPGVGIGNVNDGFNNFPFTGDIDEISLYNRALSSNEIVSIYNAGSAGKCPIVAPTCASAPSGLVGWWPAEGNGNDSTGTNNATVPDGVTYAPAEVGQGFSLDGQDHRIVVPDAPQLNFSSNQDFSIEVWILPLANPGNWKDVMSIIDKRVAPDTITQLGYELNLEGGVVIFQMADVLAPFSWNNFSGGPDLRDGQFHHVAVTVQRNSTSGGQLYIDGQLVLTFDPTICPGDLSNTGPLRIGNHATPGLPAFYHGIIDEVSLYNRALSVNEIESLYHAGSAGKCPVTAPTCVSPPSGLIGWWPGNGNANDIVGGNNGVAQNITYTTGVAGQAFACDPNNYPYGTYAGIQIHDQPAYVLTNALSIEGWIRPRGDGYCIFFRGDDRPGLDPYVLSMQGNNNLRFYIEDESGNYAFVGTDLNYNQWYYVAATWDGSTGTMSLYTNGVLAGQTATDVRPFGELIPEDSPGVGIGNVNDGFNNFPFVGDIDEISLYNRALTAAEIQSIYNAGSAGKCQSPPSCTPAPSGLISWWPGEGNAQDVTGNNNGTPQNITYTNGEVGQAFVFSGSSSQIMVPASPSLNVGLGSGFTFETWINTADFSFQSICEWNNINGNGTGSFGGGAIGAHLELNEYNADGSLWGNIIDTSANAHIINTVGGVITPNTWQHVAMTYDKTSGVAVLYRNGVMVATQNLGVFTPQTSSDFFMGNRPAGPFSPLYFNGKMDEPSLYNRALSASEIKSIYNAGSAGKCAWPFPPAITVPPVNQTSVAGSNVVLSVVAGGTGPFSYQWSFNGTNILGATNATLTLTNLHPNQSGSYAATITTPYGTIASSGAIVTVMARNILVYKYSGAEKITTAGQAFAYGYSGQMFFIPDSTNGTFVGWGTIKGKKQYWVNSLSDYLLITIPGASNQTFTVLGRAGQGIDTNGCPHIWSYLHKGKNTPLTIGQQMFFSFPNNFSCDATHVYPDSQTGNMVLSESSSIYTFLPQNTQTANNTGQTMTDLVNALTQTLAGQGYQTQ